MLMFNETATTEIYTYRHTLALHDALPISARGEATANQRVGAISRPPRLRDRGGVERVRQPGRAMHLALQPVVTRAFGEPVGAELLAQAVDIPQIAHPSRQIAVGEQIRGGRDEHNGGDSGQRADGEQRGRKWR